jgi:large subunit ribosomal protein L17
MRHHNNIRKFGRNRNQRNALLKGLVLSLIAHGKIETTEAKAKELRPYIEKIITKAKIGTLASKRNVISCLYNRKAEANKIINDIAPKYINRSGGYTRIMKLSRREGDASKMAIIEFI